MNSKEIISIGKDLLLGDFSAVKSYTNEVFDFRPSSYNTVAATNGFMPDFFWTGGSGKEYYFTYEGRNSSRKAYEQCSPLTSIINRKAQAYITGQTWVMGNNKKESQSTMGNRLRERLKKPNPLQSWAQFEAQQYIYIQLFGYSVVMPIIPVGFEEYGPIYASSMWNIPPYMLTITETNKLFYQTDMTGIIKDVHITYKGAKTPLDIKNLFIFKDVPVNFESLIFPESRIKSLELPVNNIIGAMQSRNVLIRSRGALGILTPEKDQYGTIPLTDPEKQTLQNEFSRYGIQGDQWKFIISPAAMKWQQMGVATRDLLLNEEVLECSKMLCDGYNYPPHLMGLIDPTFNNQNAAMKGMFENAIIPEALSNYEQWNQFFRCDEYNILLEKDYSHLRVLQEDALAKAQARVQLNTALEKEFKFNLITRNRWLELLGEDAIGPEGDKYYSELASQGMQFVLAGGGSQNQIGNNAQE